MKPSAFVNGLVCIGFWLIPNLALAEPLIAPTAIDWLLDCPLTATARLDPEVVGRTQCGLVSVPRDHAAPQRGRIRLSVTRVGARQPLNREGVVFIQAGDPQRVKDAPFVLHLASRWESLATTAYRTLVDRYDVIELSTRDLRQGNAVEQAARDREYVRGQLGGARLNSLGNAAAPRLGSRYGTLFPERVGRMVLINTEPGEALAAGVEQLLLKESAHAGADGCVSRWLGDFLAYGKQPPASARCLDSGAWE
ncbi:proteinase [Pseudomonas sp. GL93]|uniref:alpha/beta hydrolase n=1 Tax=Pseudomonas sp. GL93 TaxID=2014741 RepID=UPI000E3167CC|nr:alpha/beta hydrolase [Pseudomonas sp. GL93]RFD26600.1 proteinase [Pseudomonas sp. GL93]